VYKPDGRFGTPLKLILKFITSLRVPVLLLPKMGVVDSSKPALAPPKGTVFTNGKKAPPLFEIENADEGMLSPTPSVSAAVELAKKANKDKFARLGRKLQDVMAVIVVLPGLLALPALKVKFTALAERLTDNDSCRTAFRAIGWAPEFTTCARLAPVTHNRRTTPTRPFRIVLKPIISVRIL